MGEAGWRLHERQKRARETISDIVVGAVEKAGRLVLFLAP